MIKTIRTMVLAVVSAIALTSAGTALAAYTTPKLLVTDASPSVTINFSEGPTTTRPRSCSSTRRPSIGVADAARWADDRDRDRTGHGRRPRRRAAAADRDRAGPRRKRHVSLRHDAGADRRGLAAVHRDHDPHRLLGADPPGGRADARAAGVRRPGVAPPGASASAFASGSIQACLPPPDVPVGTPGRATFGFK